MQEHIEPIIIDHLQNIRKNNPDDLFICCASFEERSTSSILKMADDFKVKYSVIIIIEEPQYELEIMYHLQKIQRELVKRTTERLFIISCQRQNPSDELIQLREIWKYIPKKTDSGNLNITVDISGFTKIYLLEMLQFLIVELGIRMPRILHTTQSYLPTKLTKGVEEVDLISNFIGEPSPGKETLLILFLGFEPERALTVWENFYPSKTIALLTNPPRDNNFKYLKYAHDNNSYLISRPSVEVRDVPSDNAYEVQQVLESIWKESSELFNIIIGPFGTKPQTIGVFLFWLEHREVQIVYSFPVEYTKSYLRRNPGYTMLIPIAN